VAFLLPTMILILKWWSKLIFINLRNMVAISYLKNLHLCFHKWEKAIFKRSFYGRSAHCLFVSKMTEKIMERVEKAIEEIRPNLQADGGDVELVDVNDGVARVRLKGACAGCPMSTMTVKWGVESFLKRKVPEITRVETV
jgi:Fe-S cluster biogenesis protein NfuA